jgi:protein TonB
MPVRPEDNSAFLRQCLLQGDSAQEARVRHRKQRALLISIIVQIVIVATLVLFPLFTNGENIAKNVVLFPPVPYSPVRARNAPKPVAQPPHAKPSICSFCFQPKSIPPPIVTHDDSHPSSDPMPPDGAGIPGAPEGKSIPGTLPGIATRPDLPPPPPLVKERLHVSESVIAARLIRRIEPSYPPLAVQIRREGRVELHAIIATDGSIQSLEVLSGDPFFVPSALSAVREWRYQPTLLNGQPVEIDTHITVIYTLKH